MDRLADVDQGLRVAIVGGGWAGLAAGVELCAAGARITLFEAARQLGGRARSIEIRGHALDNGQHILSGAYRETLRLMRRIGADPEQCLRRLALELDYPGEGFRLRLPRLPAPLHLAFGLLGAKGCTLEDKVAATRFMRALQATGYRLPADGPVAGLLDRHRQRGALRRLLWEPLCLAALNTPPEHASAQIFANVLRDSLGGVRADTDLLLPAADLGHVFPAAAAGFIERHGGAIRLSARVEAVEPGLAIHGERFDRIILAVAPQHAARLLAAHAETAPVAAMLAGYRYEPIGTVYLGYPPEVTLPFPMTGLDGSTGDRIGQWAFDRGTLCGSRGVISFVLSGHGEWEARDNGELAAALHRELQEALGKPLPPPLWHQAIRERRATFACRPGLPRPAAKTPAEGLWLAGDYVFADYPATLESAVRSGIAAAAGALRST